MYIRKVPSHNEYTEIGNLPENIILISQEGTMAIRDDENVVYFSDAYVRISSIKGSCEKYKIYVGQLILENP